MAAKATSAKQQILGRINAALGSGSGSRPSSPSSSQSAYQSGAEFYRREGSKQGEELRSLLVDRLEDYDATVTIVENSELAGTIHDLVAGGKSGDGEKPKSSSPKNAPNADAEAGSDASCDDVIIAPAAVSDDWFSDIEGQGFRVLRDEWGVEGKSLTQEQINSAAAVVTGSAVTIADTGTIVLAGAESGRRMMTLLPDHHVVVVPESSIVELVPEAMTFLREQGLHTEPMTFVSGPSATVDIELIRVHGVHGPRQLDVVIVSDR